MAHGFLPCSWPFIFHFHSLSQGLLLQNILKSVWHSSWYYQPTSNSEMTRSNSKIRLQTRSSLRANILSCQAMRLWENISEEIWWPSPPKSIHHRRKSPTVHRQAILQIFARQQTIQYNRRCWKSCGIYHFPLLCRLLDLLSSLFLTYVKDSVNVPEK